MKRIAASVTLVLALVLLPAALPGQTAPALGETDLSGLSLRGIGPALNSGRLADIAIHPDNQNVWYAAVASGGVWKTENAGTTWTPIFDGQSSYSIGSIAIDPGNPATVWVGTGENNGGRHIGFGDGVYKSTDGGRSWENMGLEASEHVSTIIVHPEDSDVVWVSAQGPLWSSGGERGLFKTTDGGETWTRVLDAGEWTGVTDLVIDPRDPDVLYAATWQRHRTVAALMSGGPGSGIHKSTDGGETWTELTSGLPSSNMGKIGLAISPQDPDILYAAIELDRRTGGIWMSEDRGASWRNMSDEVSAATGPHYYQELYASPHHFGRIYLVSSQTRISRDHGATFERMNNQNKHVDDHAIAFRKDDPDYLVVGTDGGLFETFDDMETWRYITNLPVMQYYKISVDDAEPFYHVFGGTQDNGSNGGLTRTAYSDGIRNVDWFKTLFADGHGSATEPGNPDIIYGETQQGGLYRIDRITGEQVAIQPQAREGEPFERYNWDAPIEISPHSPTRMYFASYRVWRTDDRGDSWTPVSGDLTRSEERLAIPIMGRVQSWDNPWDVLAMSNYNTITSLGESPVREGLIWAGTDDGLLHVTEDGGQSWRRIEVGSIPGIPATAFVNDIKADMFDANTVYVALDNHKYGDYAPYLVKSTDLGATWTSVAGDLPDRHLVWRVVQDHVEPNLMFAATEFGLFFTVDGGGEWIELSGAPTISFRDVVIQRTHEDVVGGTFGRGIFVLDDYTPLRHLSAERLSQEGALFPIEDALWYQEAYRSDSQGDNDYSAPNPPHGATFTYHLRDGYRSLEAERQAAEGDIDEAADVPFPGWDALEAEGREQGPTVEAVIRDSNGDVVARVDGPTGAGLHRVSWGFQKAPQSLVGLGGGGFAFGQMARPGTYSATLVKTEAGQTVELAGPEPFEVVPLRDGALPRVSESVITAFADEAEAFQNELARTNNALNESIERVEALQTALSRAERADPALARRLYDTRLELLDLREAMNGSEVRGEIGERGPPTPGSRLFFSIGGLSSTYGPTEHQRNTLAAGRAELAPLRTEVERLATQVLPQLERAVEATGAPPLEDGPPFDD